MSRSEVFLSDVSGIVTAAQLTATVDAVAEWQLESGMVPWFPGGHADTWNHTEALMALMLGGRRTEAELGFRWLQSMQRPDGSWHQYYLADRVEQDKLDANCCAYVATGVWFHWLLFEDRGVLEDLWPMVSAAVEFVLDLQTRRGEILWARHADGTPWSFALLTGSSSISHSLRCAIAIAEVLGHDKPDWELSAARLSRVIRDEPDAFAPKHRWAMDWYYPVLCGAITGESGRERLHLRVRALAIRGRPRGPPPRTVLAREARLQGIEAGGAGESVAVLGGKCSKRPPPRRVVVEVVAPEGGVQQGEHLVLGGGDSDVIDERCRPQSGEPVGEGGAGHQRACRSGGRVIGHRLDVEVERIHGEPARRAVGARRLRPIDEELVQRIDADEACPLRGGQTRQVREVGEIADAPVAP